MIILQVHKFYYHRDGASNYCLDLSHELAKRGHTVVPFAISHPQNEPTPYARFFGPAADLTDITKLSFRQKMVAAFEVIYSFRAARALAKLLDEVKIDVAHIHNIYNHLSPAILRELKKRGIPIVMTVHDYNLLSPNYTLFRNGAPHPEDARGFCLSVFWHKAIKNSYLASALAVGAHFWQTKIWRVYKKTIDQLIFPSQFAYDLFLAHGYKKEKMKRLVHPICNYVRIANNANMRNDRPPIRQDSNHLQNSQFAHPVVYIGRVAEEKGIAVLLAAAKLTPEINYRIVGECTNIRNLRNSAKIVDDNVVFTGFKTGVELEEEKSRAKLFVLPSIWYENYPLAILEASARGVPTVASNIGGIPEMLPAELLVEPNNPELLAQKIRAWYHKTPDELDKVGEELSVQTADVNSLEKHLRSIEEIYMNEIENNK